MTHPIPFPRTALLVEDEPAFRSLIGDALRELGSNWSVRDCATGSQALAALREPDLRADLVLVDLGLPDASGIQVIRAARERYAQAPILVVSVHADEHHVLSAIRAGAWGYILKDSSPAAIAEAIRRVLDGEYPISPALARYLFKLAQAQDPRPAEAPRVSLAPKELQLLTLLSRGHSYKMAARAMSVEVSTVQTYVRRIYLKLEANSKMEAVSKARDHGLL